MGARLESLPPRATVVSDDDLGFRVAASWCDPGKVTYGGHLELTSTRLAWTPTSRNQKLGAKAWSVPVDDVREIGKSPRTWCISDGGIRVRMRIATADGGEQLFVVNKLNSVLDALGAVLIDQKSHG